MAKINQQWTKFLAIGCSHGHLADRSALDSVLAFSAQWKPQTKIHLGDYLDMAAFRSGAKGSKDEAEDLGTDSNAGLHFLEEFGPTHVFNGNHEDRLWNQMFHYNAIVREAARGLVGDIRKTVQKLHAKHVETYDITDPKSVLTFGDAKFLHGFMYTENAIRDHAEHFGKCVLAHLHTPGAAHGRRDDSAVATCVGMLADRKKLSYAKNRRATARWNHGFAWGEYSKKECIIWLSERNRTGGDWRLPL